MNITIFKQEEGERFMISFSDVTSNGQEFGGSVTLNREELQQLRDEITRELEVDNFKEEVVWNPRSQRHEIVRK